MASGACSRRERVERDFTAVPNEAGMGDIRFGLGAIRNVGTNVVEGRRDVAGWKDFDH
jgi:DNA polymerase III alpha subunit